MGTATSTQTIKVVLDDKDAMERLKIITALYSSAEQRIIDLEQRCENLVAVVARLETNPRVRRGR